MHPIQLFYSWQSDRQQDCCRNFIRIALEEAIAVLKAEHSIEVQLDSDTQGVAGTPNVSEVILSKIRRCELFVGDVTFVAATDRGKHVPNPNVLIEFGFARGVLSDTQILSVMNTAFGGPKELPFDLAYLRHPIAYCLPEEASRGDRRGQREAFARHLVPALKMMADNVIKVRGAQKPAADRVAPLHVLISDVIARNQRAEVPVLVAGPKLVMQLATAPGVEAPNFYPQVVNSVRNLFLPRGYHEHKDLTDVSQWAGFDPPRRVSNKPNPEGRWYTRLLQNGVLDAAISIGVKVDDDPTIQEEAGPIEARIIEIAQRLGQIALGLSIDGPLVITAGLQNVEELQIRGRRSYSRPLQLPSIPLGAVELSSVSEITTDALRPIIEALWRAAGSGDGSPLFDAATSEEARREMLSSPVVVGRR